MVVTNDGVIEDLKKRASKCLAKIFPNKEVVIQNYLEGFKYILYAQHGSQEVVMYFNYIGYF